MGSEMCIRDSLRYAYNGFEVLVTPRRHREKREAEGREGRAAWRDRELTPDRALRKLRDKIKRSLNKAARGEHEAIVARAPPSGQEAANEVTAADACKAPALAQLDDWAAVPVPHAEGWKGQKGFGWYRAYVEVPAQWQGRIRHACCSPLPKHQGNRSSRMQGERGA